MADLNDLLKRIDRAEPAKKCFKTFVNQHDLVMNDVPSDGSCGFHTVLLSLKKNKFCFHECMDLDMDITQFRKIVHDFILQNKNFHFNNPTWVIDHDDRQLGSMRKLENDL